MSLIINRVVSLYQTVKKLQGIPDTVEFNIVSLTMTLVFLVLLHHTWCVKSFTFSVSFFSPASVALLSDLYATISAVTDVSPVADAVLSVSAADDDGSSSDDGLSAETSPAVL